MGADSLGEAGQLDLLGLKDSRQLTVTLYLPRLLRTLHHTNALDQDGSCLQGSHLCPSKLPWQGAVTVLQWSLEIAGTTRHADVLHCSMCKNDSRQSKTTGTQCDEAEPGFGVH